MIDRLLLNGIDVQEQFGFYLKWKVIQLAQKKGFYQDIPGADGQLDYTEANGRVYFENRAIPIGMVHPELDYRNDLDSLLSFHGEKCKISFASDPSHYFVGRFDVGEYDTESHELEATATVFPYRFETNETVYTISHDKTIRLVNDIMTVTPLVEVTGGPVSLAWGSYTKTLSAGSYYIDNLILGKLEMLDLTVSFQDSGSVRISYRKGRL